MPTETPQSQPPLPARVLVVDDHPLVREGLCMLIRSDPALELAAAVGSGTEARAAMERSRPHVALVDLSLPDIDGIALVESLRQSFPNVPVLVLSMHEESIYAARAMRAGASGYLMKHAAPGTVAASIQAVLRGEHVFSEAVRDQPSFQALYRRRKRPAEGSRGIASLSNRELQVFDAIGRSRTTAQIAAALGLSEKTVETHRAHIKRKLGLDTAAALTHEAFRWVESESAGDGTPQPGA